MFRVNKPCFSRVIFSRARVQKLIVWNKKLIWLSSTVRKASRSCKLENFLSMLMWLLQAIIETWSNNYLKSINRITSMRMLETFNTRSEKLERIWFCWCFTKRTVIFDVRAGARIRLDTPVLKIFITFITKIIKIISNGSIPSFLSKSSSFYILNCRSV